MTHSDVLIVGAGPTGLVLALWLTKLGVKVRIVDKTAEHGTTSRALAVQVRTLELYSQLGLADAVVEQGHKVPAVNFGGDRLPWVPINGKDNFEPLAAMSWQVHVYGAASAELTTWCASQDVPLHVFEWRSEH